MNFLHAKMKEGSILVQLPYVTLELEERVLMQIVTFKQIIRKPDYAIRVQGVTPYWW